MTGTDVDVVQSQAPAAAWGGALEQERTLLDIPESEWQRMWTVSKVLASSRMVPQVLQGNPEGAMAVGLHCRALRVPFSLLSVKTHFHVWQDSKGITIQPSAQLMLGLLHRAGHGTRWGPCDDESATLHIWRDNDRTQDPETFVWTFAMARKANLANKDNWKYHPGAMLRAAAARTGVRYTVPEALLGLDAYDYTEPRRVAPAVRAEAIDVPVGDVAAVAIPSVESLPGGDVGAESPSPHVRTGQGPPDGGRRIERLRRQIEATSGHVRDELAARWGAAGLPRLELLAGAGIDQAEDIVDAVIAWALETRPAQEDACPSESAPPTGRTEAGSAPGGGGSPTGTAGPPPARPASPDASAEPCEATPSTSEQQTFGPDDPGRPFE